MPRQLRGNVTSSEPERFWGFIKDPIHGYIRLTGVERRVIDTLAVQRLRRIRQLAGADYVYPAANHTRFEHVIGAMYLAGVVVENLPVALLPEERQRVVDPCAPEHFYLCAHSRTSFLGCVLVVAHHF